MQNFDQLLNFVKEVLFENPNIVRFFVYLHLILLPKKEIDSELNFHKDANHFTCFHDTIELFLRDIISKKYFN